jgi:hypothetical protein
VVGGDRLDRPVPKRVNEGRTVVGRAKRRVHLHVRIERADGFVGHAEVVRGHFGRRRNAGGSSGTERRDRLAGRDVEDVNGTTLEGSEREVTLDHDALRDRRIAGESELGRDGPFVHLASARERRLFAVQRERAARDSAVLERSPH